jgi:elongation factor P hydroxylase
MKMNTDQKPKRIATISTSDRSSFRTCRRMWDFQSHLRQSLSPNVHKKPLWFGTGFHYVLEDFYGYKLYDSISEAIDDYKQATIKYYGEENLPSSINDDISLMYDMLDHYFNSFLTDRENFKTFYVNGVPQIEVPIEFEIPVSKELLEKSKYDKVIYKIVVDRVVIDEFGNLWIVDYKTTKTFTNFESLQINPQIGAYTWVVNSLYDLPVAGFIFEQFRKDAPKDPKILKDSSLSGDTSQLTNYKKYRHQLVHMYGNDTSKWPNKLIDALNYFASQENDESDRFVKRDRIQRTPLSSKNEAIKLLMEVSDMLSEPYIYPNPTFRCTQTCSFLNPCQDIDDDLHKQVDHTLKNDYFAQSYSTRNEWRKYLKINSQKPHVKLAEQLPIKVKPKVML